VLRRLQFSLWYYFRPPWDSGISPPELMEFIAAHPAGRALDLGCGTGTNVITLAQHGWQVSGIDFAPRAIQIARRKMRAAGVQATVSVGDATVLKGLDGTIDLALDIGCFHGMEDRQAYLSTLERVLAPSGYWLMYGFFKSSTAEIGPGLEDETLKLIDSHGFLLRSRSDGADKRGRPSAWFLYQRPT
jgi:ubiquinone/menaquinone biosynthesis C-methylase UbiE